MRDGAAVKRIPLAVGDAAGNWTIRARDILSGQVQSTVIQVH